MFGYKREIWRQAFVDTRVSKAQNQWKISFLLRGLDLPIGRYIQRTM